MNALIELLGEYAQTLVAAGITATVAYLKRRHDLKQIAKDKASADELKK